MSHQEAIECPACKLKQFATVEFEEWMPFPAYVHECVGCKYIIMESEWTQVNASEVKE